MAKKWVDVMKIRSIVLSLLCAIAVAALPAAQMNAQNTNNSGGSAKPAEGSIATPDKDGRAYSGMYTFLKDGEFLQVTVEDGGSVTGYVSRYGDGESDKGAFLDQFFKNGKLDGNKLSFTTEIVHGVAFDFHGAFERGEGKTPGEEAYFILKGTLTENISDANKKVTSHAREVAFKLFPQESGPAPAARN